mgnify:FL=1
MAVANDVGNSLLVSMDLETTLDSGLQDVCTEYIGSIRCNKANGQNNWICDNPNVWGDCDNI